MYTFGDQRFALFNIQQDTVRLDYLEILTSTRDDNLRRIVRTQTACNTARQSARRTRTG